MQSFRAEHIGSLLRPKSLLDLRRRFDAGDVGGEELAAAEDAAIREAVSMQERIGLNVVTDGEFRRGSYHAYFFSKLGEIDVMGTAGPSDTAAVAITPRRGAQPVVRIGSRLSWGGPIHGHDFSFVRSLSGLTPKITIPGPCALHFRGGDAAVVADAYDDVAQFWDDTVNVFQQELRSLADAGCTYVQFDETAFAKFGDPDVQQRLAQRGDNWSRLIDFYIDITNRILDGAPEGMTIGMHLCRGNRAGLFHSEGSYDAVSERLFNALKIDLFFLEYDSPRAGDFSPLRFVPKSKRIVLGLISTKTPELEPQDDIRARIDDAARYVGMEQLALSPQCGFASVDTGNPLTPADQEAKLKLVVDTAHRQWGSA